MVSLVVICQSESNEKNEQQFAKELEACATVEIVENFSEFQRIVTTSEYDLLTIMTLDDSFPESWDLTEVEAKGPTLLIRGAKDLHVLSLTNVLRTLEVEASDARLEEEEGAIEHPVFSESLSFIEKNLHEQDLSLDKVAAHVYMSRCHYSRLFKHHLGQGFKVYVMNKRIQRAKHMLQKGGLVTDVCYSVGYNDLTHFARVFKRMVGVNPSNYRHQYRKTGGDSYSRR